VTVARTVVCMTTTTTPTDILTLPAVGDLTLQQLVRWLATQHWSDFATSLVTQHRATGRLTVNQVAAAKRMYVRARERAEMDAAQVDAEPSRAAEIAEARAFVAAMRADEVSRSIDPGFYVGPGDTIWHVKRSRGGGIYALRHSDETGEWDYVRGAMPALVADRAAGRLRSLDVATAGRIGQRTGRCLVCSRLLTDEDSVAAGIGPVCAKRL
jgi:hypothetical protein